ncbi:HPr family phosphocarrier protein [Geosporobacter ferrireducens]|uniref:Phosphocarrier protein HPr n=1 Tax=Geosporobacter ferrireducens TaxID=1424294 RepID=A0A1D8GP42_9FIRM|nr:HPr family phosphocarrier protein [Geosporobacter ferrireducens]AOT72637.1 phosphocarrier protein HPr [Geosporobacter ferrireducens]MTI55039.1 HPr family phosphocarrier protein [Geosporobacter ferrireducens]
MYWESVVLENEAGLHARPASVFTQTSLKYKSDITISKEGKSANAKSIISVLSLGISKGTEITISAEGEDEEAAVTDLVGLIQSKMGEA